MDEESSNLILKPEKKDEINSRENDNPNRKEDPYD